MNIFDALDNVFKVEPASAKKTMTLQDYLNEYDVVEVAETDEGRPFVVVTDRQQHSEDFGGSIRFADPKKPDINEIGSSSASPFIGDFRREYNYDMMNGRDLAIYDKMRKSDGIVNGSLLTVKTPVNAGRWFMEPYDDTPEAEEIADFVWSCFTEYMSITWSQVLEEAMLMCDFGYYIMEKVWEQRVINGKKRWVLRKLAPRHPMDVKKINYDKNGGPVSVTMYVQDGRDTDKQPEEKDIPVDKLIIFTYRRESGNLQGRSVLRTAYKHWYFKEQLYKIDAIQKERHGIGIPVIKLPPNFSVQDKGIANQLGRNLRTNERAHVVLPPFWELFFAKLEGNPVDALKSIEYHDAAIRENVLAGFVGGERVTKEEDMSLFLKATRFIASSLCDSFNLYVIPQIVKYNFDTDKFPKLKVRRIGEQADFRVLSMALRNLIGSGVIRPDDRLEEWAREELDMPKADISTVRVIKAPQAAQAGSPTVPNATSGLQAGKLPNDTSSNGGDGEGNGTNIGDKPGLPKQPLPNDGGVGGKNVGRDAGGQS